MYAVETQTTKISILAYLIKNKIGLGWSLPSFTTRSLLIFISSKYLVFFFFFQLFVHYLFLSSLFLPLKIFQAMGLIFYWRWYFTFAGWHTYFWIAFIPFIVSSFETILSHLWSMYVCTFDCAFKVLAQFFISLFKYYRDGWLWKNDNRKRETGRKDRYGERREKKITTILFVGKPTAKRETNSQINSNNLT